MNNLTKDQWLNELKQKWMDGLTECQIKILQEIIGKRNDSTCWDMKMRHNGKTLHFEVDFFAPLLRLMYDSEREKNYIDKKLYDIYSIVTKNSPVINYANDSFCKDRKIECKHIYKQIFVEADFSGYMPDALYICKLCNIEVHLMEGDKIVPPASVEITKNDRE